MTGIKKSPINKGGKSGTGKLTQATKKGEIELKESELDKATGGKAPLPMKWPE